MYSTRTFGLSMSDAQYMICKGTYGGRIWSLQEQQAACDRYEQMTGSQTMPGFILPVLLILFVVTVVSIIAMLNIKTNKLINGLPGSKDKHGELDKNRFTKKGLSRINRKSTLTALTIVAVIIGICIVAFVVNSFTAKPGIDSNKDNSPSGLVD